MIDHVSENDTRNISSFRSREEKRNKKPGTNKHKRCRSADDVMGGKDAGARMRVETTTRVRRADLVWLDPNMEGLATNRGKHSLAPLDSGGAACSTHKEPAGGGGIWSPCGSCEQPLHAAALTEDGCINKVDVLDSQLCSSSRNAIGGNEAH